MPSSRGSYVKAAPTSGFDHMAVALKNHLHDTFPSTTSTISGVIKNAFKHLKTSFFASLKGVSTESTASLITPSTSARSRLPRSVSNLPPPAPVFFPSMENYVTQDTETSPDDDPEDIIDQPHRLDQQYTPISCTTQALKRLRIHEIPRLCHEDEFILLIPPTTRKDPKPFIKACDVVLNKMRSIVLYDYRKNASPAACKKYFDEELENRRVNRNGRVGYEFHVKVMAYPERARMELDPIPESEMKNLLLPETGVGVTVQLIGYSPTAKTLLKLYDLALLEVYVPKPIGEQVYDDVKLVNSQNDDVVASDLAKQLLETKGDATAYIAILMQHYKANRKRKYPGNQPISSRQLDVPFVSLLKNDAHADKILHFADEVDRAYKTAMCGTVGFDHVCEYLISPEVNTHFYNKLRSEFPYIHEALYSVVSSKYFVETEMKDDPVQSPLRDKQNQILYLFYGLIRTRSNMLMRHWAIVEPLGYFYKGNQQPASKSMGGMFLSTLPTCFDKLDAIYESRLQAFMSNLEFEPVLTGAFDNYQRMIQKKDQTAHKSAISHIGTAMYVKENVPIHIPKGSAVRSPSGMEFKVLTCSPHACGKLIVTGEIYNRGPTPSDAEKDLIVDGVLMPRLGWDVFWMPGFQPRPPITYNTQDIPTPRRAHVEADATDADIVFGRDRKLCESSHPQSESLSSTRMYEVQRLAERIVDFRTYSMYLLNKKKDGELTETQEQYITSVHSVRKEIDAASKCQHDLVHHINPNAGVVDKMFAYPLSPYCETSHEGMLMAYADLARNLRMVDIIDNDLDRNLGKTTLTPSTKSRRINLCVDALSAKMFRSLKLSLTRKLTEIGSADYVEALLTALDSFTCQHDYLHEHRMHRQDVIWRQFYGCVLQAFQAETRTLRINGDPVKNNLQSHEAFLRICYRALKRHRMNRFMTQHGHHCVSPMEGESERDLLLRWDHTFTEYCSSWDDSGDEPTRICNNLIRMLDGYFRSVNAVHKRDFWLCEVENIIWQGAYKACGKNNYIDEAMHRIDTLYGLDGMTDVELENFRANRFFLMTALGDCMSLDEVNELLNLWFKKCLVSPTFQINVNRSKHIMCLMKCGYETFGTSKRRSSKTSQEENVEKIVLLLERTNVFPVQTSLTRMFDDNFFWREVRIPKASGTDRDKQKEEVVMEGSMKGLFNVMCVGEEMIQEYSEYEQDNGGDEEVCSVVISSTSLTVSFSFPTLLLSATPSFTIPFATSCSISA